MQPAPRSQISLPLSKAHWEPEWAHKLVKSGATEGTRVRLIELARGYDEGWCESPHVAYVVSGRLAMRFDDRVEILDAGDAAILPGGPAYRHRPEPLTDKVVLLLVEADSRVVATSVGQVTLGGARARDLGQALALLARNGLPAEGVREAFDAFVVAHKEGELVGLCGLEVYDGAGLLRSLVVRDEFRRAGLGRALVDETRQRARYHGLRELYLLTTTASDFFAHRGFAVVARDAVPGAVGESWEFRAGCPVTATVMRWSLERPPTP